MEKMTKILGIILLIVLGVVGLVIVFSIIGGMSSTITDSANSANYPNNCSSGVDSTGVSFTFNLSGLSCANSTGNNQYEPKFYALPLISLFSAGGLLLLILMSVIFLVVLFFLFKMVKK